MESPGILAVKGSDMNVCQELRTGQRGLSCWPPYTSSKLMFFQPAWYTGALSLFFLCHLYLSSKKNYTFFKSHHQSHFHFSVDVFGPSLITSASLCTSSHSETFTLQISFPLYFTYLLQSCIHCLHIKVNVSLYQRTIGNGLFNVEETIYCQSVNKGWLPPICQALIRYW